MNRTINLLITESKHQPLDQGIKHQPLGQGIDLSIS